MHRRPPGNKKRRTPILGEAAQAAVVPASL